MAQCLGQREGKCQPLAEPTLPAFASTYELRIDAEGQRVEEVEVVTVRRSAADGDLHGAALAHGGGDRGDVLHAQVGGEVVEGPGGKDSERNVRTERGRRCAV